jgi:hypothetical protein
VLLAGADLGIVAGFLWLAEHTSAPLPVVGGVGTCTW